MCFSFNLKGKLRQLLRIDEAHLMICDRWSSCMQSPGALDIATVIFASWRRRHPGRTRSVRAGAHTVSIDRDPDLAPEDRRGTSARHIDRRANVPYGMVLPLKMGEVIVGIAVLGASGAEVSASHGGLD